MNNVHLVTFATIEFESYRQELIDSAKSFNIKSFHSYSKKDIINTDLFKNNKFIFSFKRGFGLWLWKPFIILKTLEKLREGEILIYADSGCLLINDPSPLYHLADSNIYGLVAFNCSPITNKEFVKKQTFINMKCDSEEFWNSPHIIATVLIFKKTTHSIKLVKEWLKEMEIASSLVPEKKKESDFNLPEFIEHREDQSIFSLLVRKKNIKTYRNPSKWGDFLKMEAHREFTDVLSYPYNLNNSISDYSLFSDISSPYNTIFEFNRNPSRKRNKKMYLFFYEYLKKMCQKKI
jgi:hypothetical protein